MKEIIIKSEEEFKRLPEKFNEETMIRIEDCGCIITKNIPGATIIAGRNSGAMVYDNSAIVAHENAKVISYGNAEVKAFDNSRVEAYGHSSVELHGNASAMAYDESSISAFEHSYVISSNSSYINVYGNAEVKAFDKSQVRAHGGAKVILYDNCRAIGFGNPTIEAHDNSQLIAHISSNVRAFDKSHVEAYGNSSIKLYGNAEVEAYDKSLIAAYDNAIIRVWSSGVTVGGLFFFSTLICHFCECKILKKHKTAKVVYLRKQKITKKMFFDMLEKTRYGYILYKAVDPEDDCSGKIKYEIGKVVEYPNFDPDEIREYGGGLHLSPTIGQALNYNKGKILKCAARKKDIVINQNDLSSVRCRRVKVLEEVK